MRGEVSNNIIAVLLLAAIATSLVGIVSTLKPLGELTGGVTYEGNATIQISGQKNIDLIANVTNFGSIIPNQSSPYYCTVTTEDGNPNICDNDGPDGQDIDETTSTSGVAESCSGACNMLLLNTGNVNVKVNISMNVSAAKDWICGSSGSSFCNSTAKFQFKSEDDENNGKLFGEGMR